MTKAALKSCYTTFTGAFWSWIDSFLHILHNQYYHLCRSQNKNLFQSQLLTEIIKANRTRRYKTRKLQDNNVSNANSCNNYWLSHQDGLGVEKRGVGGRQNNRHTTTPLSATPHPPINVILFPDQSTSPPSSTTVLPSSTSTPSSTTSVPANGKQELITWMSRFPHRPISFKILSKFWWPVKIIWTDDMRFLLQLNGAW